MPKILKRAKKTRTAIGAGRRPDAKKEAVYRKLSAILRSGGYEVRREQLRQGPGWRALSGTCRVNMDKLVIVDSRMTQQDQISFLVSKILDFQLEPEPTALAELPPVVVRQLEVGRPQSIDRQQILDPADVVGA